MNPLATTSSPGIRHGIACLILLALPLQALAAAHLHGVVRKNELGGEPLALVTVASPDANPSSSDSQGRFRLGFPKLEPGEKVALDVRLKGWVVVNDLQLEDRILPRDARANPVTFLLARPEEKQRWALVYYRIKGRETVETEYRKRLAERERDNKSTARERDQLARERDQALAQAEELARQLAAAKPGDGDALYREATRLYLDNRLDEALRVLDEKKLQDSAAQAGKLEADARKLRRETSRNWRLRGKLLAQRFQFAAAGQAYAAATRLMPEDFDAWFDYAKFHQELNRFPEARQGYQQALTLARDLARANPETYRPDVAMTLNNLGVLHRDQNRMEEARKVYEEALGIRRDLARANPETYRPDVATTLNNLGVLHRDQNRMEEARKAYEEALDIRRDLARANPETYRPDVAATLNNLGILHHDQNRMEEARQAYEEALDIYRDLARASPETYRPYVAMTLNNLGNLHSDQNRMGEARQAYEEARDIYRDLVRANPETYRPYVAGILNNLGILHRDQNRMEEARKAYEEALFIYREFAARSPEAFMPYVRKVRANLDRLPK